MRKTTVNLIVGILIGLLISEVSDNRDSSESTNMGSTLATTTPIASTNTPDNTSLNEIAPGLQIIEVPPPLDLLGNHPYQCYMNGQPIGIPKELVKQLVAKHGNPTSDDPNFNIHNFTQNLRKRVVHQGE